MTDRDRLIELLKFTTINMPCEREKMADHLIANGVIVLPCKVGDTERDLRIVTHDFIKAEAYKECIEKVKENSNKMELVCSGTLVRTDYTITEEKLDNLLKELVGDK